MQQIMKKELSQNLKTQRILSSTILLFGVILLTYMIKVEGEPGALPLFLILVGTVWLIVSQIKIKKHNN